MNEKIKLWVSFTVIVLLFVAGFWYTGMVEDSMKPKGTKLPPTATNVVDHGEGWYSFDLTIGDKTITIIHHFDKPIQKEDTAQPIDDEFLNDWRKSDQPYEDHKDDPTDEGEHDNANDP